MHKNSTTKDIYYVSEPQIDNKKQKQNQTHRPPEHFSVMPGIHLDQRQRNRGAWGGSSGQNELSLAM